MKDWKIWAPIQTKEQREIADNLSESEKEEAAKLAKELGRKGAFFMMPLLLAAFFLYEYSSIPFNIKLILMIALFVLDQLLFWFLVGSSIRSKQKALLNNSKYAKANGMSI
jgi:hypothetical protein